MSHDYRVNLFSPSTGLQTAVLDDFTSLFVELQVNGFSTHTISLEDPTKVGFFTLDTIIEVWRRNADFGIDWTRIYVGFHRTPQITITEQGKFIFTSYGRGLVDLAARRAIRFYTGSAGALKTGAAETVMKAYVEENAGPSATTPTRITDGVTTGLTVEPSTGAGGSWTGDRARNNLLTVLQEIARTESVDFDIVRTGALTFEFRTYYPQLGQDHTATSTDPVIFAPVFGNMERPMYIESRTEEVNSVLVWGQGQEEDRATRLRTSSATADSQWNLIELDRDGRQEETDAGLDAIGDEELQDRMADQQFDFVVVQTNGSAFGRDYNLGDIVTAKFSMIGLDEISVDKKIIAVTILVASGREDIKIRLGDTV